MDCIFCKIVKGELPSETVFESDAARVIKDIHPKAPVHLLIIPKAHIKSIAHLEKEHEVTAAELLYAAKNVAQKLGLTSYKLVFNVGKDAGQTVDHLHLHLLGEWTNADNRSIDV